MTKQEFLQKANISEISNEDYEVIETVYTYHPSIDNVQGKDQIAAIYNLPGGMRIIKDMLTTAYKARKIDSDMMAIRNQFSELQNEYDALKSQKEQL